MKIIDSLSHWNHYRETLKGSVGFVPTMGALHDGHLSLVKAAIADNDFSIVSIYVNPTQFNNLDDFNNYPINLDEDLKLLKKAGVAAVFLPQLEEIYPDNYTFKLTENNIAKSLEGEKRPGHFDGMLTVVMKLFNIIKPTRAYFGEKDFQQLSLVKNMVKAFFMPVDIIAMPTVREKSGLAMSSRNRRLPVNQLEKAKELSRILTQAKNDEQAKQALNAAGFEVEYVASKWNRRLAAVNLNNVRLIDNVPL